MGGPTNAQPIYLDYNATTPLHREAAEAMRPYLDDLWGNPSSSHQYGVVTKGGVERAREKVALLLSSHNDEIVFTSGGTESNNYSIKGAALANKNKGNHVITTCIEHPAVLETVKYLQDYEGFKITQLPVDEFGKINLEQFKNALTPNTVLVTVMHSNNEIGTIQPIAEIAAIAHAYLKDIIVHTDASQSIGKVPIKVNDLGVDLLTVCPHKFYGPKDIKRGVTLLKQMHGANHERDLRAGTENIILVAGLGKASEVAERDLNKNSKHMKDMRDRLQQKLAAELDMRVNGHEIDRLPNTLSVSFAHIHANTLLSEIGDKVAASAGAACHAETTTISHVLRAISVPADYVLGTIRLSTGKDTTVEEIDAAAEEIIRCVKKLSPKSTSTDSTEGLVDGIVRLTTSTHGLGCGCKMRPQALEEVLRGLPTFNDPNVLVGTSTSDDAGVYKISPDLALVQTVDFFTPIVDDAYEFGAISAANALSDVYAMGGTPTTALNIVAFPTTRLPLSVLNQILKGAYDKAAEAGVPILGGHTIDDNEPKFGLSITGTVHPDRIWKNCTAKEGDAIIITKKIGTGICTTAMKRNMASESTIKEAVKNMITLNKYAAEALHKHTVNSCTDITGFGLLGHLWEMAKSSGVSAHVYFDKIPLIQGTLDLAVSQIIPGGTMNNHQWLGSNVVYDKDVVQHMQYIMCDAQTSGGLLVSVPGDTAQAVLSSLRSSPFVDSAEIIGHFVGIEDNAKIHAHSSMTTKQ